MSGLPILFLLLLTLVSGASAQLPKSINISPVQYGVLQSVSSASPLSQILSNMTLSASIFQNVSRLFEKAEDQLRTRHTAVTSLKQPQEYTTRVTCTASDKSHGQVFREYIDGRGWKSSNQLYCLYMRSHEIISRHYAHNDQHDSPFVIAKLAEDLHQLLRLLSRPMRRMKINNRLFSKPLVRSQKKSEHLHCQIYEIQGFKLQETWFMKVNFASERQSRQKHGGQRLYLEENVTYSSQRKKFISALMNVLYAPENGTRRIVNDSTTAIILRNDAMGITMIDLQPIRFVALNKARSLIENHLMRMQSDTTNHNLTILMIPLFITLFPAAQTGMSLFSKFHAVFATKAIVILPVLIKAIELIQSSQLRFIHVSMRFGELNLKDSVLPAELGVANCKLGPKGNRIGRILVLVAFGMLAIGLAVDGFTLIFRRRRHQAAMKRVETWLGKRRRGE